LNTLARPGLQAIEPIATAEVVNGQMSWAKLYKTSSWHQVKTVLLLSLEKDMQSGASTTGGGTGAGDLQRSRHSSSDSSMASHTSAETDAKQSEAKFKYIFLLFFHFFHFFCTFFRFFRFFSLFLLFFAYFSFRFDFFA
jgi:hypothetical protein